MKAIALLGFLALAACGSSSHPPGGSGDILAFVQDESMPVDLSLGPDLSASVRDASTEPDGFVAPDLAPFDAGSELEQACTNICKCFMSVSEQAKCNSLCVAEDSRFEGYNVFTSGSSLGPGSYSGSLGGVFANESTLSSGEPVIPTSACLTCMATATCALLEVGFACVFQCPYLN